VRHSQRGEITADAVTLSGEWPEFGRSSEIRPNAGQRAAGSRRLVFKV
jgi:hypothetical protein